VALGGFHELAPAGVSNPFVLNTLIAWFPHGDQRVSLKTTLRDALRAIPLQHDSDGDPVNRVVIFDQFEELFTRQEFWRERDLFFEELAAAVSALTALRVVCVIRSDYLARLEPYGTLLPARWRTFTLERLRAPAAMEAVQGPVQRFGITFEGGAAAELIEELLCIRSEPGRGHSAQSRGEFVDPVQLQVVCQRLWQELPVGERRITVTHVRNLNSMESGGVRTTVDSALARFYDDEVRRAVAASAIAEETIRTWFQTTLLTATGTRAFIHRGPHETGGLSNDAVDVLEASHLLTSEWRAGARWYELSHDRFAAAILESNLRWNEGRAAVSLKATALLQDSVSYAASQTSKDSFRVALGMLERAREMFLSIDDHKGVALSSVSLAELFWDHGDYPGAREALLQGQPYVEKSGDPDTLSRFAEWFQAVSGAVGRQGDALSLWERIGDKASKSAVLLLARGGDRWYAGQFDSALEDYRHALAIGVPESKLAETLSSIGQILAGVGRVDEAAQVLSRAIELGDEAIIAYATSGLGLAVGTQGNYEDALRYFTKALELRPRNAWTYLNRAKVHLLHGAIAEAERDLLSSLQMDVQSLPPFQREVATALLRDMTHKTK
jgi:tetratricopeptide (TPR) repeat protein